MSFLRVLGMAHSGGMPDCYPVVDAITIISSPLTSKEESWAYTCPKCPYIPPTESIDDIVRIIRLDTSHPLHGYPKYVNLRFPMRCKPCEARKKRTQRMRKRIAQVFRMSAGIGAFRRTYNFPKLVTFALLDEYYSRGEPSEDRTTLLNKLNVKLPKVWKTLMNKGMLGGTFVLECNTKLIWSDLATEPQMWRHHPHVHCVAVSNFIHHKKIVEYSAQLLPMGLGRINLKAAKAINTVADYIGKYISKDKVRARTFGIMRSSGKYEPECRCKHGDMEINTMYCECIVSGL